MAERVTPDALPSLTDEQADAFHGDLHDDVAAGAHTGRFTWDDRALNLLVSLANRPGLLIGATVSVLTIAGVGYAVLEDKDLLTGLWWAIVTGGTVGYGDQFPVTPAGRTLGALLITSMFFLALCLGAQITSRLIEDRDEFTHGEQEQIKALLAHLDRQEEQILALLNDRLTPDHAPADCGCGCHANPGSGPAVTPEGNQE